ncbi:collagen alpha-1(III) chain-like isoform X2 [Lutra lutra]|uniref:collagen alpha-1(III) chain-like isoform X2 n=1 Tax=Lutra lutra TaxID=9657 RepID=UPI001FD45024|nr:collagen alpha-1(III) chain-like isoform X2 [Lutra lutra]
MAPVSGALGSARGRYRQSPVGGWGGLSGQRDGSLGGVPGATPRTRRGRPGALGTDGCVPCASAYRARAQGTAEEPWRPPKSRRPAGASAGTGKRFRREGDSGSGAVSGACSAEPSGGPCGARVRGWGRARGSVSCGPDRARTLSGRRGIARSPRGAPCDPGVEAEDRAARRWLRAGSAGTRHGCRPSAAGLGQGGRGPCCPPRLGCGTAPRLSGGPGGGGAEALGPAVRVWSRRRRTRADRTDGAPRKHSVGGHTGARRRPAPTRARLGPPKPPSASASLSPQPGTRLPSLPLPAGPRCLRGRARSGRPRDPRLCSRGAFLRPLPGHAGPGLVRKGSAIAAWWSLYRSGWVSAVPGTCGRCAVNPQMAKPRCCQWCMWTQRGSKTPVSFLNPCSGRLEYSSVRSLTGSSSSNGKLGV